MPDDLAFLHHKVVLYYAGLDVLALPFGEAASAIARRQRLNLSFIKALTLFVDHVAIPPSFFIEPLRQGALPRSAVGYLAPLYAAGWVVSPIYEGMGSTRDFLEHKLKTTKRALTSGVLMREMQVAGNLFREIPVLHRNVQVQSAGFLRRVSDTMRKRLHRQQPLLAMASTMLHAVEGRYGIPLSREEALAALGDALKNGKLTPRQLRSLHYLVSGSYFAQGAETYNAAVALPGAVRYGILGKEMFTTRPNRVLVAYDPELLLDLLRSFGIRTEEVDNLSPTDLQVLHASPQFAAFRDSYYRFAVDTQELLGSLGRLSASELAELRNTIFIEFHATHGHTSKRVERKRSRWGLAENIFWSISLGALGFAVGDWWGLILGGIPPALQAGGTTERVIERFAQQEHAFHQYLTFLDSILVHVRRFLAAQRGADDAHES